MTTTPTHAARVSGTISKQLRIAGWHDAADYVAGEWMQSRILAAIQPDPEPVLLDETSLRARIGDISNQVHNLACRHQNDEDLCVNLGELSSQLWELARNSPTTPSSAGTVSVEAAAQVLLDARNRDGMTVLPEYVREMLRALAGEGEP